MSAGARTFNRDTGAVMDGAEKSLGQPQKRKPTQLLFSNQSSYVYARAVLGPKCVSNPWVYRDSVFPDHFLANHCLYLVPRYVPPGPNGSTCVCSGRTMFFGWALVYLFGFQYCDHLARSRILQ
jgi:hypothetical protein